MQDERNVHVNAIAIAIAANEDLKAANSELHGQLEQMENELHASTKNTKLVKTDSNSTPGKLGELHRLRKRPCGRHIDGMARWRPSVKPPSDGKRKRRGRKRKWSASGENRPKRNRTNSNDWRTDLILDTLLISSSRESGLIFSWAALNRSTFLGNLRHERQR
jgi:hypothetical protein